MEGVGDGVLVMSGGEDKEEEEEEEESSEFVVVVVVEVGKDDDGAGVVVMVGVEMIGIGGSACSCDVFVEVSIGCDSTGDWGFS